MRNWGRRHCVKIVSNRCCWKLGTYLPINGDVKCLRHDISVLPGDMSREKLAYLTLFTTKSVNRLMQEF